MQRMYTFEEVAKTVFNDKVTGRELDKLASQYGTYRDLGKTKMMTEGDIDALIGRLSRRKSFKRVPQFDEGGLLVVIGSVHKDSPRWIGWCSVGEELDLLDRVQFGAPMNVKVLYTFESTFGDYQKFSRSHLRSRMYGRWHHPDQELSDELEARLADELNAEDEGDAI